MRFAIKEFLQQILHLGSLNLMAKKDQMSSLKNKYMNKKQLNDNVTLITLPQYQEHYPVRRKGSANSGLIKTPPFLMVEMVGFNRQEKYEEQKCRSRKPGDHYTQSDL